MPATETCMHCHSQLWTQAELLEPVRESWRTGTPIAWNRVHDVPDFVFFDHSVHVNNGVSCYECHGRVDQMPLMTKKHALFMGWCLECHRDPGPRLRPSNEIVNLDWKPPGNTQERAALAAKLLTEFDIQSRGLTDCITCHR